MIFHQVESKTGGRTHAIRFADGRYSWVACGVDIDVLTIRRARFEKAAKPCGNCKRIVAKLG